MVYIDNIVKKNNKQNTKKISKQHVVSKKQHVSFFAKYKIIISVISILAVFIIIIGVYIYYNKKNDKNSVTLQVPENILTNKKDQDLYVDTDNFHILIQTDDFYVDTDIIEGNTDESLHKGVVHQSGSAFPSEYGGNVVITGHRWYPGDGPFSKIFYDLDKLKQGGKIVLKYKNKKYIYNVEDSHIVNPEDTSFLKHTTESYLTIYTCHPKHSSQQRLVYRAKLIKVE
jgi:LPXTG-site transpeptidase (sortase) family protein